MNLPLATEDPVAAPLREIVQLHFDPAGGAPYWLEKARQLGIDARKEIRFLDDLAILGPMDARALSDRPVEDFIPASLLEWRAGLIFAETGGTLGRPKFAVHGAGEFESAFVEPFVVAARRCGFPRGENWLYVGPTGPHIIGKAARACANALGSPDPFTVDFDPRWARKLPEESFARSRYLRHIEEQALRVLETQHIGIVFSTPPVLESLGEHIPGTRRDGIHGIHFGGMPVSSKLRRRLAGLFPQAVMMSGYGNTLVGMAPELAWYPEEGIDYYPHGTRLVYRIVEWKDDKPEAAARPVAYGQRGRVMVHRLDRTQFIANLIERDCAVRIPPRSDSIEDGFILDGLRDPQPIVTETVRPAGGLY